MKYITALLTALLISSPAFAGLITHTDYTAGNVITAAGQNTNENAIFNEFNGNINSANIAASGVATSNIAASAVTLTKLDPALQSTFTLVNQMGTYRRPVLVYALPSKVDISSNTNTLNQTCVMFPDIERCVTENVLSTTVNRRLLLTVTASNTGSKASGLAAGETLTANRWYSVYAWKVSDNSTDFVLAASSNAAIQANYTRLNNMFGPNAWVYIGSVRYGAGSGTANSNEILNFVQNNNFILFVSTVGTSSNIIAKGYRLTGAASGSTTLTYSYSSGMSTSDILPSASSLLVTGAINPAGLTTVNLGDTLGASITTFHGGGVITFDTWIGTGRDISESEASSGTGAKDIVLKGYMDGALGEGFNGQF